MRKKINTLLGENAHVWYEANFTTKGAGTAYALEAFYSLCRNEMARILPGKFSRGELMLMIDVSNGLMLTSGHAGQHIFAQVEDGINLDRLDEKWSIDKTEMLQKLQDLPIMACVALEIWCRAFWEGKRTGQEAEVKTDLEEYVKQLAE